MSDKNILLMAHLMRRAGFGASKDELIEISKRSYEDQVDLIPVSYTHLPLPTKA